MSKNDICAICLANAAPRGGGEFLITPGCCGKWFHQSCIDELRTHGKNFCPACMKAFPAPAPVVTPAPAPAPMPYPPQVQQQSNTLRNTQAPTATGIFSRIFSRQAPTAAPSDPVKPSRNPYDEDEVVPEEESPGKHEKASSDLPPAEPAPLLSLTVSPEYNETSIADQFPFHVRVSTSFNNTSLVNERKTPLDVVCVLDNSGSMSGSKIDNLKRAMEFVISSLGEKDRLSIVSFNSDARTEHGLWKMTSARKAESKALNSAIHAGGGTDIYRGMQSGWNILQSRRTKNPASCLFLLTDGQDGSYLEEKKALAKTMREQGTALFVFGFGNDHDSAHLIQISNAAEGSFVYVETNDTVIDAFGGAIGSQQGQLLRDIRVNFETSSPNVLVEQLLAGSYANLVDSNKKVGHVSFADLYGGEKRDFLIQTRLPEIADMTAAYQVVTVSATYRQHGSETILNSEPVVCVVKRVSKEEFAATPHVRDVEVDAQIQRLESTRAITEAMNLADRGDYTSARNMLAVRKQALMESPAFRSNNATVVALQDDINDCENKVSSRSEYEGSGGRAYMTECTSNYSRQRYVYAKKSAHVSMQSASSNVRQMDAMAFKSRK